ncbi:MAG: hypothetical protein U0Z26_19570 [Anaerolineales bacterium]
MTVRLLCPYQVERYISRGYEFIDAIRLAYGDLEGDYAFVIGRADDDKLYAFKKALAWSSASAMSYRLSSDLPSILPLTREVIRPQDGEIVTLWADRVEMSLSKMANKFNECQKQLRSRWMRCKRAGIRILC